MPSFSSGCIKQSVSGPRALDLIQKQVNRYDIDHKRCQTQYVEETNMTFYFN